MSVFVNCFVCGCSYEQIKETAVLIYKEFLSSRNERYQERQRRRDTCLAGKEQGTVLFVSRGVSQAAACDCNFYQIVGEDSLTNPQPMVLPI